MSWNFLYHYHCLWVAVHIIGAIIYAYKIHKLNPQLYWFQTPAHFTWYLRVISLSTLNVEVGLNETGVHGLHVLNMILLKIYKGKCIEKKNILGIQIIEDKNEKNVIETRPVMKVIHPLPCLVTTADESGRGCQGARAHAHNFFDQNILKKKYDMKPNDPLAFLLLTLWKLAPFQEQSWIVCFLTLFWTPWSLSLPIPLLNLAPTPLVYLSGSN